MRDIESGRKNNRVEFASVMICAIAIIVGILFIGSATKLYMYGGDDQINNLDFLLKVKDKSIFQLIVMDISKYIKDMVSFDVLRYFPFGRMTYLEASVVYKSITAYRYWILIYLFLDLTLFAGLIYRFTNNKIMAVLTICLAPVMFNLNLTWTSNALYCYAALVFRTFMWMLLSLHFMINWITSKSKLAAVLSALSMFIACLIYEMAYINVFLAIALAFSYRASKSLRETLRSLFKSILPVMVATVTAFILYHYSRTLYGEKPKIDTQVAIQPMTSLIATLKEMAASTPLVSAFYNDSFIKSNEFILGDFIGPVIFGLLVTALLIMDDEGVKPKKKWELLRLGLLIWVLPNLLISITVRFHRLEGWADGWIVSAIGTYGVTLIVVILLMGIKGFMERAGVPTVEKSIVAILLFTVIVMSGAYNHAVARKDSSYGYGQEIYEFVCDSMTGGVTESVPKGNRIVSNYPVWGDSKDAQKKMFLYYAGKVYDAQFISSYDESGFKGNSTYVYNMISGDDLLFTYVGKAEAADLRMLSDVDVYVDLSEADKDVKLCYLTIESGEEVFHSIERSELLRMMGDKERGVVAVPGEHILNYSFAWK